MKALSLAAGRDSLHTQSAMLVGKRNGQQRLVRNAFGISCLVIQNLVGRLGRISHAQDFVLPIRGGAQRGQTKNSSLKSRRRIQVRLPILPYQCPLTSPKWPIPVLFPAAPLILIVAQLGQGISIP